MLRKAVLTVAILSSSVSAFDYPTCCREASDHGRLFNYTNRTTGLTPSSHKYSTCGQKYSPGVAPAKAVYITYHSCRIHCRGFDLTAISELSIWVAPLVQFIIPSIIFSLSIPRGKRFLPVCDMRTLSRPIRAALPKLAGARLIQVPGAILYGAILALCTAADTIVWIAVILMLAGPLMISGITEAVLDTKILYAIAKRKRQLYSSSQLQLLLCVVGGNLLLPLPPSKRHHYRLSSLSGIGTVHDALTEEALGRLLPQAAPHREPDALTEVSHALDFHQDASAQKAQMLYLMSAQGDFGVVVGAPVAFFLGGFIYNIVDLLGDPAFQDPAITLAFGVQWMIVVHVAIVSGCLLASNNPSAICVLSGLPPPAVLEHSAFSMYKTRFQPVSMLERGPNKIIWLRTITNRASGEQQGVLRSLEQNVRIKPVERLWWVLLPTLILISLPSAAGAVVAWRTPPVGWGCRSLTLVCYAACQLLVTLLYELRRWSHKTKAVFEWTPFLNSGWRHRVLSVFLRVCYVTEFTFRYSLSPLYWTACFLALFTSLGGTVLQIMGVYRNCICYVNAPMWTRLDEAFVQVASDTYGQRHASTNWIKMGCVASGFMAILSCGGWWYQKLIRAQYRRQVGNIDS